MKREIEEKFGALETSLNYHSEDANDWHRRFLKHLEKLESLVSKPKQEPKHFVAAGIVDELKGWPKRDTSVKRIPGCICNWTANDVNCLIHAPLRVRVAKLIGWEHIHYDKGIEEWMGYAPNMLKTWSIIPDFPDDIALAMGAFWDYLIKIDSDYFCIARSHIRIQDVSLDYKGMFPKAEDFCLAIISHAKMK